MTERIFGNVFGAAILAMFIIVPLTYIQINNGTLTIERPYYDEWKGCEIKLSNEIQKNTPSCSPCECKESGGYYVFLVLGSMIYVSSIFFLLHNNKKMDKRKKELDEREEKLKLVIEANKPKTKTKK